jgi:hypothetical protein
VQTHNQFKLVTYYQVTEWTIVQVSQANSFSQVLIQAISPSTGAKCGEELKELLFKVRMIVRKRSSPSRSNGLKPVSSVRAIVARCCGGQGGGGAQPVLVSHRPVWFTRIEISEISACLVRAWQQINTGDTC